MAGSLGLKTARCCASFWPATRTAATRTIAYRDRYSYYGYEPKTSQVSLAAGALEHVVPKLCATGRLVWMLDSSQQAPEEDGLLVAWDDGPAWRFRLCVGADDPNKRWRLEGQLVREGEEAPIPLSEPVLLLAHGLVLLKDRIARLAAGDLFAWIVALRQSPAIEVPYKDRWDLLGLLWRLPSLPEMDMPANLRCEEVRVPPQGRLIVHSPERHGPNRLYGDVEFLYDGKRVPAGRPFRGHCRCRRRSGSCSAIATRSASCSPSWRSEGCGPPTPAPPASTTPGFPTSVWPIWSMRWSRPAGSSRPKDI